MYESKVLSVQARLDMSETSAQEAAAQAKLENTELQQDVSALQRELSRACATALEGAGERGYEFPRWFPVQIVREEGREDELLARMGRAQRGELSAEDEARTRDAYARWKMRRAGRG